MKLLTRALLKKFAQTGRQDDQKDPLMIVKFFHPCSMRTRYASEYDPKEKIFFGYVHSDFAER